MRNLKDMRTSGRLEEYRGRSSAVASDRLRLKFDAVTTPGVLFMDSRPIPSP